MPKFMCERVFFLWKQQTDMKSAQLHPRYCKLLKLLMLAKLQSINCKKRGPRNLRYPRSSLY